MYYIREIDKPNMLLEKLNIVRLKNDEIILPIKTENNNEKTMNNLEKLAYKTNKILAKTNSKKLVLSKNIKKQKQYVNYLYAYDYDIVDGVWLFKILLPDVLEHIIKKKNLNKSNIQISILTNNISELEIINIKNIVKNYKKVNIVTFHIEKLKKLEQEILREDGIVMNIGNNKKKGLIKTKIILNLDFPQEVLNKYNINDEAIIVNFEGGINIEKKRFNGININDYEIKVLNSNEIDFSKTTKFALKDIYEAEQYKTQPIKQVIEKIRKDDVQIDKLIARKTII